MDAFYNELKNYGIVKTNELLSKHTTFKIGGPARFFIIVNDLEKLTGLLNYVRGQDVNYIILGGGSNMLMSDNGFDGLIIKLKSENQPQIKEEDGKFLAVCEAGVALSALVDLASRNSLSGMEWGVGIPGTVGGAIRGNAGAMGKSVSMPLKWVEVWRDGEILKLYPEDCCFEYRDSIFKKNKDVIIKACVVLEKGEKQAIVSQIQNNLQQRKHSSFPSAGSFFKNLQLDKWPGNHEDLPEKFRQRGMVPVGWMSEQLNLKGYSVGGAKLSEDHGNYIVNANNATQADVLTLVEEIKGKIYNRFGVELEPEVEIIK
ncbi:MAG: UDP-N-acetylmuramate dehydrogenase [Patescibacteria group bacterium]